METGIKCVHCGKGASEDHRWCLVELFKTNKIKTVKEWEEMSRVKKPRRVRVLVPKE